MGNQETSSRPQDNLPVTRRVIQAVSLAAAEVLGGVIRRERESAQGKELPDIIRSDLLVHEQEIEEILQDEVQRVLQELIPAGSIRKWNSPIARGDSFVQFTDLKAGLENSKEQVVKRIKDLDLQSLKTPEAVGIFYDRALQKIGITIDRISDPEGAVERLARVSRRINSRAHPSGSKGIGGR